MKLKEFAESQKVYPHTYQGKEFYVFSSQELADDFVAKARKAGFKNLQIESGHPKASGHPEFRSVQEIQSKLEAGW